MIAQINILWIKIYEKYMDDESIRAPPILLSELNNEQTRLSY